MAKPTPKPELYPDRNQISIALAADPPSASVKLPSAIVKLPGASVKLPSASVKLPGASVKLPGASNNGRLTKVQTAANAAYGTPETVQNYDYDKLGQVVKHVQSIGNQTYSLEYGYNLAGQMVSEKYPSGRVVTMAVDNFGRLSGVADAQRTYLSGVTINDKGLLSQINLGNGTSETFAYNDRFQMEQQELKKGAEVLQKYVYGYGQVDAGGVLQTAQNNGQLGTIESFIGASKQATQKFRYDHIGRLKESAEYRGDNNSLTYKQVFDFDRFGNLYRKAASNPTAGQQNPLAFTAIEDTHISKTTNRFTTDTTYDDAGQVINDAKFRSMSFGYDANGRQVKAVRSGVPDAWTVYDALGNRVATKINDVWQYVVYDAFGKCVAEYGQLADGVGGVKYVQQDWQGSVRTVTNANGFVVSRTDHQAFGGEVGYGTGQRSIDQGYNRDATTRQGYGLTERDEASGLDHTWFRKNENLAGRWTSPDPYKGSMSLADPQSFNRYSYVQNQPTNFVDPSGLQMAFCITYVYGMEYKFEDGTIIRVPEGTNTICFGGGPPETGPPNPGPGSSGTGGTSATNPARNKNADNKLNNCMINATGDWARANARAYSDLKRTVARTALLTGVGLIFAREVGGIALGGSSAYFAHEDYRIAMNRNNDDLERSTRKCLGDNPNASRSAKNLAVNEANTNIGETRIQYF